MINIQLCLHYEALKRNTVTGDRKGFLLCLSVPMEKKKVILAAERGINLCRWMVSAKILLVWLFDTMQLQHKGCTRGCTGRFTSQKTLDETDKICGCKQVWEKTDTHILPLRFIRQARRKGEVITNLISGMFAKFPESICLPAGYGEWDMSRANSGRDIPVWKNPTL